MKKDNINKEKNLRDQFFNSDKPLDQRLDEFEINIQNLYIETDNEQLEKIKADWQNDLISDRKAIELLSYFVEDGNYNKYISYINNYLKDNIEEKDNLRDFFNLQIIKINSTLVSLLENQTFWKREIINNNKDFEHALLTNQYRSFHKLRIEKRIFYFKKLIDYIDNLSNNKISLSEIKGFQSNLTSHQIESLFGQLKGTYIDKKTNPEHFKAIFKNQSLPSGFIPIEWIEAPVLLSYLIYTLKKDKKIRISNCWKITSDCFNPKSHFKQLADGFINSKTGNPKGFENINRILNNIYSPLQ